MNMHKNHLEHKPIILASASPRRKEILSLSGLDFDVMAPSCREDDVTADSPSDLVERLSVRKCEAGCLLAEKTCQDALVIGADTIVCHRGIVLGKPKDEQDAAAMLHALSGDTHVVYTGVTVKDLKSGRMVTFHEMTEVVFYELSEEEIDAYVNTGEPMDKAGAYGIQGRGAYLVKGIYGDYLNVVGLPFAKLLRVLRSAFAD